MGAPGQAATSSAPSISSFSPTNGAVGTAVTISGATPVAFNGTFVIFVVDANTFTYTLAGPTSSIASERARRRRQAKRQQAERGGGGDRGVRRGRRRHHGRDRKIDPREQSRRHHAIAQAGPPFLSRLDFDTEFRVFENNIRELTSSV